MRTGTALLPLASFALLTLGGCAAQPNPEDYASLSDDQLCTNYGYESSLVNQRQPEYWGKARSKELRDIARAEIQKRSLIPERDWTAIDTGTVVRGMHKCSVLAAWGTPIQDSTTQLSIGTMENIVYADGSVAVLRNGTADVVTSAR